MNNLTDDINSMLELLKEDPDEELRVELLNSIDQFKSDISYLELSFILGEENDAGDAVVHINSGAGGTESMDWADMLFRMIKRWAERNNMGVDILDIQSGEEAGIKSCMLLIKGEYAFGKLKAEAGVHRLVRISPFDSSKRRHTSFASIYVYPDSDEDIDIEIKETDLRIDTYRSSGAGGQHVNTTDSAVRITHLPTGIVVQCQNQRSQHQNKDKAMKILKSALHQRRKEEIKAEQETENMEKKEIGWGSQIRSYVLHPYKMIKDHRTGHETSNTQRVLNGEIDDFIEIYLKSGKINSQTT